MSPMCTISHKMAQNLDEQQLVKVRVSHCGIAKHASFTLLDYSSNENIL